jgi:hypothetical protein
MVSVDLTGLGATLLKSIATVSEQSFLQPTMALRFSWSKHCHRDCISPLIDSSRHPPTQPLGSVVQISRTSSVDACLGSTSLKNILAKCCDSPLLLASLTRNEIRVKPWYDPRYGRRHRGTNKHSTSVKWSPSSSRVRQKSSRIACDPPSAQPNDVSERRCGIVTKSTCMFHPERARRLSLSGRSYERA